MRYTRLLTAGVLCGGLLAGSLAGCCKRSAIERPGPASATTGDRSAALGGDGEPILPPPPCECGELPAEAAPFWPRLHGPAGDNLSRDRGLLPQWPSQGPPLAWMTKKIGCGFASVTLAGGLIFTAGGIGDKTVVSALDLDGNLRWRTAVGKAWTGVSPGARATPTIDGNRLYYESPLGEVVCLCAASGEKVWGVNILDRFDARNTWKNAADPFYGLAESPLIDGERLICSPHGRKASLVALDKHSGRTLWAAPPTDDLPGYATAQVIEHDGLRIVLAMDQQAFLGVNAESGDLLWRFEHRGGAGVNATQPVYHDGRVLITSGGESVGAVMLRIKVRGLAASVEEVWRSHDLDARYGGVLRRGGYLYGTAHEANRWICLDWNTGKKIYSQRFVGRGSLTWAEGMLYLLGENGSIALVEARPDAAAIVSRFKLPSGGEGPSMAHPVVCGGRLYLRHDDRLYAYDLCATIVARIAARSSPNRSR